MVVDRAFGVLTRIDPTKAEVTGQLVVDYNPGDVVFVDERFAWLLDVRPIEWILRLVVI